MRYRLLFGDHSPYDPVPGVAFDVQYRKDTKPCRLDMRFPDETFTTINLHGEFDDELAFAALAEWIG
jgi:hypothetical protein